MTNDGEMSQLFKDITVINKERIIEKQEAKTIYNINGDLIYQNNKARGNKNLLNKYLKIDYSVSLDKNFNKKETIVRNQTLAEIQKILKTENCLLLYGNPGIGKTFLVSEIKKNYNSIYISVKNKSEKEIYLYLISKFLSKEEIESKELIDIEDIKVELEISMSDKETLLIFDDIEKNTEIVDEIISLELFENKVFFVSRTSNIKTSKTIFKYELKGFADYEISEFLKINNIELDSMKIYDLIEASQGNPLYLYYFSHYQITPLPENLIEFQATLWNEMTPLQKGIISLVSIPLFEISFGEIKKCIEILTNESITIFNLQNELENLSHLLVTTHGRYSVFHLSLSEYILEIQNEYGVLNDYKKILANTKVESKDFLEAVYLLLDIPETNLKEIILFPIVDIQRLGLLNFGVKVLEKAIQLYNGETNDEIKARGYSYHWLTLFYKDLYMVDEAIKANKFSIECFEQINDLEALLNAKLFQALDLLENNNEKEACILVKEIEKKIPKQGYLRASLCANLSKFYIDLTNYEEAKKYAEFAYIEFQKQKEKFIKVGGIKHSLNNLAISYSFLKGKENLELSIKYGKLLYDLSLKTNDLRTRASITNLLTRSYREIKDYKKAYEFCNEAIKLSKLMKSDYLLIVNIINKGNIYKNEEKNDNALECYFEAKAYSLRKNILKEEVRALKLILDIYLKYKNYKEGKKVAAEFLDKSKKLGIYYRIYEAYDTLSEISYNLDEEKWKYYSLEGLKVLFEEKKYEEAVESILKILNNFSKDLTQIEVQFYYELLIKSEAYKDNLNKIMTFIAIDNVLNLSQKIDILNSIIQKLNIEKILSREMLIKFIDEIQSKNEKIFPNKIIELIESILKNKDKEEFNTYFFIIIIGFSKYFDLIVQKQLLEKVYNATQGFYYRKTLSNEFIMTVSCSKDLKLQIVCDKLDLVAINVAIIIGILFKFNAKKILEEINELDERYYTIFIETYSYISNNVSQEIIEKIKEKDSKSKPYIVANNKENGIISFFLNNNFQENISLLKEEGMIGVLSILLQLFVFMSKVEINNTMEKKNIELLISMLLPQVKNTEESLREKIDLIQVENYLNNLMENL